MLALIMRCASILPEISLLIVYILSYIYCSCLSGIIILEAPYLQVLNSFKDLENSIEGCDPNQVHRLSLDKLASCTKPQNYDHIKLGGHFKPPNSETIQKVALIVPYRDREKHLKEFSSYIHKFLPCQSIEYSLYIIEQTDSKPFNRAKLFNIGVEEIEKLDPAVCCFIFHDVDLLPLDPRNLYMCSSLPKHMSVRVSSLRYKLPYSSLFGGVTAFTKSQFKTIGGFSNNFYGWGGEDDDIFKRIRRAGLNITRTPSQFAIYDALRHPKAKPNENR